MAKAQDAELAGAERTISTLQWVLGILFSLLVTVTVALVGVWSRNVESSLRETEQSLNNLENEHRDFHRILDARADLPNRTAQLETGLQRIETRLADINRRLR